MLETDPVRSALLARVRQRGTKPELVVGGVLRALGMAYRCNVRTLPGAPDFANRRRRWAVLVNGCFWHHHTGCRHATIPKRNHEFWAAKLAANRLRDARAVRALRAAGFDVRIVWECATMDLDRLTARLSRIGVAKEH